MSYQVHTEEYRGLTIAITHDDSPANPRGKHAIADHLGTMIGWTRDYISPDPNHIGDVEEFRIYLKERRADRHSTDSGVIGLIVEHDDRSGEWDVRGDLASLEDDDQPDGVIFATYEEVRIDQKCRAITSKVRANVLDVLRAEVAEYSAWASGNVWGFTIAGPDGPEEVIDSCWGFTGDWDAGDGDGWVLAEARAAADHFADRRDRGVNDEEADQDMAGEIAELTAYYAA